MEAQKEVPIRFCINGKDIELTVTAAETALQAIRERLLLTGTKEGCGIGECGACTIVVDGRHINACLMPAAQLQGREVFTVEGLQTPTGLHPLQKAFLHGHAIQCGFCAPGMLMSAHALLQGAVRPLEHEEVVEGLSGNLCRCTGYQQILAGVQEAARDLAGKPAG